MYYHYEALGLAPYPVQALTSAALSYQRKDFCGFPGSVRQWGWCWLNSVFALSPLWFQRKAWVSAAPVPEAPSNMRNSSNYKSNNHKTTRRLTCTGKGARLHNSALPWAASFAVSPRAGRNKSLKRHVWWQRQTAHASREFCYYLYRDTDSFILRDPARYLKNYI